MGFLDQLREGADRRQDARELRAYSAAVDRWVIELTRAAELLVKTLRPEIENGSAPVQLRPGERLIVWWTGADLIAPKNMVVRNSAGGSYRLGKRTTVRYGTTTVVATVDKPTPIDRGVVAITDQRVLFLGHTRSIDWQFARVLGITHDESETWTAIHVSNRQRLHGFGYPAFHADDVE